jgi:glyoxylase-like metal-dependent hydrolase (beta-lactamase superfamily II)
MGWKIECVVVGPIQCNCYILSESNSGTAYVIDPGAESRELLSYLQKKKFDLKAVLITHAHIDHVGGIEALHAQFPVPVYYHAGDRYLYENLLMQAQLFGALPSHMQAVQPTVGEPTLRHDQVFGFAGGEMRVIHTPGHTPGSVCFHAKGEEAIVFSGDTLFDGSIGRTDLWGGNYDQIIASIKDRLLVMEDAVQVLPGHGEPTTIGKERRSNPFLQTP